MAKHRPASGQLSLFDCPPPAASQPIAAEPPPDDAELIADMPRIPAKVISPGGVRRHDPGALKKWKRTVRRWIIDHAQVRAALKRLLRYLDSLCPAIGAPPDPEWLGRHRNRRLVCWPSLRKIGESLSLTSGRSHVSAWLRELARDFFVVDRLRKRPDGSRASTYRWIAYAALLRTVVHFRRPRQDRRRTRDIYPPRFLRPELHRPFDPDAPASPASALDATGVVTPASLPGDANVTPLPETKPTPTKPEFQSDGDSGKDFDGVGDGSRPIWGERLNRGHLTDPEKLVELYGLALEQGVISLSQPMDVRDFFAWGHYCTNAGGIRDPPALFTSGLAEPDAFGSKWQDKLRSVDRDWADEAIRRPRTASADRQLRSAFTKAVAKSPHAKDRILTMTGLSLIFSDLDGNRDKSRAGQISSLRQLQTKGSSP